MTLHLWRLLTVCSKLLLQINFSDTSLEDAPEKPATNSFKGCDGVLLGQANKGQTAGSAKYQRAAAIHRGASQITVCLY